MLKNKKTLFLLVFTIILFILRLTSLNETIYDDESNFAFTLSTLNDWGFNTHYFSHWYFNILYMPLIGIFGLKTWIFRIIPWFFGIAMTILNYFFCRRNYSEKVAFYSTIIMAGSFYATLASLQFDVEGSLVSFAILLLFFSYLEYEKTTDKKKQLFWQILAGIGLGLAVLKFNPGYTVITLGLYALYKRGFKIRQLIKDLFPVYFSGLIIFMIPFVLGVITSPDTWINFLWVGDFHEAKFGGPKLYYMPLAMFFFWATPLLFGFYLLSLTHIKKKLVLPILWITIPLIVYTLVLPYGAMDRYFMNVIPALTLIGGYFLAQFKFEKKHIKFGVPLLGIFTILLFFINTLPHRYIGRFPALYLKELLHFNTNFLFAYTSASGPTFGVNFTTIALSFSLAFLALFVCLMFVKRKREISKWAFLTFVIISLSFNIFLTAEFLFHPTGIDVSKVKSEMMEYVNNNNLDYPIYTNDQGVQWYFDNLYWHNTTKTVGFADNELRQEATLAKESIEERGGTVLLVHWPPLHEESPAWDVVEMCQKEKDFHNKGILVGNIYTC